MMYVWAALIGYVAGSISFARIITFFLTKSGEVKQMNREIPGSDETFESTSISATVMAVNHGKKYGCLTGILDMFKVVIPTWLVWYFFPDQPYHLITALTGMAGHNYPVFHRFKGGRGQTALIGGLLVINWYGLIASNLIAVVLGYLVGSVLMMRWGWMVVMIAWFAWLFGDIWHIAYIVLANALFWFSMLPEIRRTREVLRDRKSTQEEISDFLLMGKRFGRFIDNYGFPALLRKAFGRGKANT